jgi:hypothetical protein
MLFEPSGYMDIDLQAFLVMLNVQDFDIEDPSMSEESIGIQHAVQSCVTKALKARSSSIFSMHVLRAMHFHAQAY